MAATKPAPYDFQIEPNTGAQFSAEKGRYHLYVTYSCPFACRALSARNLLGLQDVIGVSIAHPMFQKTKPNDPNDEHKGWTFVDPKTSSTYTAANGKTYSTSDCIPDTVNGVNFVRDLYEKVDPAPRTFSVPVLWDTKTQTIVSEGSTAILRTLDSGFRELVPSNVHLYPEELRAEIDAVNDGIVSEITMGYLKLTFAKTAVDRYLVDKRITEADVRIFQGLIRLDVYQKKTDKKHLTDFPVVVDYQTPALKSTVNWEHLKLGVENKHPEAVYEGPFVDYDVAPDRAQLV
ncbi:hypothetical protein PHYSODRAFT_331872 [Phytophthora sojae]|uniref:GST N-terminal domain-containing protein n=1 Tax=Phytophthora sojae (strain P6497) TaxID=1094619 RepID=G4ZG73_PHYSP|nr:hypothetical protein PHYSODRAFT_331872 [Phytophthora sojae]EGZ17977.1 hypothetical protein PHYSODRAFT_331872 [Phytophthora sojae]|eukprot:XP_009527035.1 hypothetical protein PHYSODRAFT_331872 [Phytophthora sojae]